MQDKGQKDCPHADAIVSYMYDEMPVADRSAFEGHLVACQICTDDFAAVSVARFETFDWKRQEFDPLATPQILIPYQEKTVTFAERLSALLSWATVMPVAAVVIVCLGLAFVLLTNGKINNEPSVASIPEVQPEQNRPILNSAITYPETLSGEAKLVDQPNKFRPASAKKRPTLPRSLMAKHIAPAVRLGNDLALNIPASQTKPAPRLGLNDDEDDRSLRLADLFDETNPPPHR